MNSTEFDQLLLDFHNENPRLLFLFDGFMVAGSIAVNGHKLSFLFAIEPTHLTRKEVIDYLNRQIRHHLSI